MEQSTSLTKLLEAADLLGMLEDLTNPSSVAKLSPASLSGLRITLRTARETILSSHDKIASILVAQARSRTSTENETPTAQPRMAPPQRDLRSSLEKFVEKQG